MKHLYTSLVYNYMYMCTLHIEEGICLPVNVMLGLTRNVTIRHTRH